LQTRKLLDATDDFPEVVQIGAAVGTHEVILDGEVVALDEQGRPSFGALQRRGRRRPTVVYMVFDLLYLDGRSTMGLPFVERRRLLEDLGIAGGPSWQVPPYYVDDAAALLEATRAQGLEGLLAKRLESIYEPGKRSRATTSIRGPPARTLRRAPPGGRGCVLGVDPHRHDPPAVLQGPEGRQGPHRGRPGSATLIDEIAAYGTADI
jgi:hypothetical protein